VVLDANVLFPFSLRDTLLRAAGASYFQFFWTEEILDEARRNGATSSCAGIPQQNRLSASSRR